MNYNADYKEITLKDLDILRLYLKQKSLEDIASSAGIKTKQVIVLLEKSFKKISSFYAKYSVTGRERKILKVTESDFQSFKDSSPILYRLKTIRKAAGFKMADFEELEIMTRQTYSKIESGTIELTEEHTNKIINFYNDCLEDYYKIFRSALNDYTSDYRKEYGPVSFGKSLSFHNYFKLTNSEERKILEIAALRNINEIDLQVFLYLEILGYISRNADERRQLKNRFDNSSSTSERKNLNNNMRQCDNQELYADDVRSFMLENLKIDDFKVDNQYMLKLLFLPRVNLNEKIIGEFIEQVKFA